MNLHLPDVSCLKEGISLAQSLLGIRNWENGQCLLVWTTLSQLVGVQVTWALAVQVRFLHFTHAQQWRAPNHSSVPAHPPFLLVPEPVPSAAASSQTLWASQTLWLSFLLVFKTSCA